MDELITWLMNIEHLAEAFYRQAAEYFKDDPVLKQFLEHIAEDEKEHYRIMKDALEYVNNHSVPVQAVTVDEETISKIQGLLDEISQKMATQTLTKDFFYECVVSLEQFKFNHIFIYVVNTLKELIQDFERTAGIIQNHQRFIKYYYENNLGRNELTEKLRRLPKVWEEKILVVDDEEPIRVLITALLHEEGTVENASHGGEALEKLKHTYYRLILCDIAMPHMDGITFYREAHRLFPTINKRFLFFSGKFTPEHIAFFKKNGLRSITKPAPIKEIRKNALEILLAP